MLKMATKEIKIINNWKTWNIGIILKNCFFDRSVWMAGILCYSGTISTICSEIAGD